QLRVVDRLAAQPYREFVRRIDLSPALHHERNVLRGGSSRARIEEYEGARLLLDRPVGELIGGAEELLVGQCRHQHCVIGVGPRWPCPKKSAGSASLRSRWRSSRRRPAASLHRGRGSQPSRSTPPLWPKSDRPPNMPNC